MKFECFPNGRATINYEAGLVLVMVGDKVGCEVADKNLPAAPTPRIKQNVSAGRDAHVAGRDIGGPGAGSRDGATLILTVPAGTTIAPQGNTVARPHESARGRVHFDL